MKCRSCGATIHVSKKDSNLLSVKISYSAGKMSVECTCHLCDTCLREAHKKFQDLVNFMTDKGE